MCENVSETNSTLKKTNSVRKYRIGHIVPRKKLRIGHIVMKRGKS